MLKVIHNPRCGKSRNCLAYLEEKQIEFEIIKYLEKPFSKNEIENLLKMLGIKAIEVVRQNEPIWVENYKNKNLSQDEVITAIEKHPILLQRPIIINNNKAFIARELDIIENKLK